MRGVSGSTRMMGLALSIAFAAASCSSAPNRGSDREAALERRAERLNQLRLALSPSAWTKPDTLAYYLELYGFPRRGADVSARWMERGGRRLFTLRLSPPKPRGRALIVHGYMSHSGHFAGVAKALIDDGYETLLIDLPGFGLSDGDRNGIDDFHSYGDAIDEVVRQTAAEPVRDGFDLPSVAVGHSTGCAALTDFVLRYPEEAANVDRLVLAAPLVRTTAWVLKRFGTRIVGGKPFAFPRLPALSKGTVGNPEFLRFIVDEDPLFFPVFDGGWFKAAERWDLFIGEGAPASWTGRVLIVQGETDDAVDYVHNIPVMSRVFPRDEARYYPGSSHTIFNETPERLEPVMKDIAEFLRR